MKITLTGNDDLGKALAAEARQHGTSSLSFSLLASETDTKGDWSNAINACEGADGLFKSIQKALSSHPDTTCQTFMGSVKFDKRTSPLSKKSVTFLYHVSGLSPSQRSFLKNFITTSCGELTVDLPGRGPAPARLFRSGRSVSDTPVVLHCVVGNAHPTEPFNIQRMLALISPFLSTPSFIVKVKGGKVVNTLNVDGVERAVRLPPGIKADGFYALFLTVSQPGHDAIFKARAGVEFEFDSDLLASLVADGIDDKGRVLHLRRVPRAIPPLRESSSNKRAQTENALAGTGAKWGTSTSPLTTAPSLNPAPPGQMNGDGLTASATASDLGRVSPGESSSPVFAPAPVTSPESHPPLGVQDKVPATNPDPAPATVLSEAQGAEVALGSTLPSSNEPPAKVGGEKGPQVNAFQSKDRSFVEVLHEEVEYLEEEIDAANRRISSADEGREKACNPNERIHFQEQALNARDKINALKPQVAALKLRLIAPTASWPNSNSSVTPPTAPFTLGSEHVMMDLSATVDIAFSATPPEAPTLWHPPLAAPQAADPNLILPGGESVNPGSAATPAEIQCLNQTLAQYSSPRSDATIRRSSRIAAKAYDPDANLCKRKESIGDVRVKALATARLEKIQKRVSWKDREASGVGEAAGGAATSRSQ